MFRAVIMDMDGTLFDTERISQEGWCRAAAETGCRVSREDLLSFRGRTREANAERFRSMKGAEGFDYYALRKIRDGYFAAYIREHGVPEKKGLFPLLNRLRERGILIGIATGTARETAEKLWAESGILPYIQFSVCGKEAGAGKPAPDCYQNAVKKGAEVSRRQYPSDPELTAGDCAVLEDAETGVLSAAAAGCRPIVIPDLTPPTDTMQKLAFAVCGDLNEATEVILAHAVRR
jgi:beta-phosphoglucomutase-like phosphatase (HAD superfamily)